MPNEIVIPTPLGPIVFRPRQVIKAEGAYFMIESVNHVRNGLQVRMYHMNEVTALKYYIPTAPTSNAPMPGVVPTHAAAPETLNPATPPPATPPPAATPPPPVPTPPPATPGQVPGAAAAPSTGMVPGTAAPGAATAPAPATPPGEVPAAIAPSPAAEDAPKPMQGLTDAEIQDGLASGKYTQDAEGNVFKNPGFDEGPAIPSNHKIDPTAGDLKQ